MRSKCTLLVMMLLGGLATTALAQTETAGKAGKKSCSCRFSSINQFGLVTGEKGNTAIIQTVNGFRYKTWFVGAGIGLDAYERLSYPIFLDLRKDLWVNATNTVPYIYADGGYSFIADKTGNKDNNFTITRYTGGLYYDIGLGFRMPVKKNSLLLSVGPTMRKMEVKEYMNLALADYACAGGGPCDGYKGTYKYRLNRMSLKLGFQF